MNKCQICKQMFDDSDTYEYRGFLSCEEHFEELQSKVEDKRNQVMKVTEKSIFSQRNGEFKNNPQKYNIHNVASDGLPIIKVKEPEILREYEKGIL